MNPKYLFLLVLSLCFSACTTEEESVEKTNTVVEEKVELVEVVNGIYSEYYPGKKQLKFQGPQDEQSRRNGVWRYYSESGVELSMTEYRNGRRHGLTVVKYPNSVLHYVGEYRDDKEIGVWKTYNEKGELVTKKDFGE